MRHQLAARRDGWREAARKWFPCATSSQRGEEMRWRGAVRKWRWGEEAYTDGEVGVGTAKIWETEATTQRWWPGQRNRALDIGTTAI